MSAMSIVAVSGVATAQAIQTSPALPLVFVGAVHAVEPAAQPGAWTLQIISRGGFAARDTRDLMIRSDAASIHPDTLVSLGQRIRTMTSPRWTVDSRLGVCSDCTATLIVLTVRDGNGLVQTHTAYWDPTTRAAIPADLLRLHDLAMTLQQR